MGDGSQLCGDGWLLDLWWYAPVVHTGVVL